MTVSVQRLAQVFVEVADTLDAEFDAAEFLHRLTLRIADLCDASAVGILLADSKGPVTIRGRVRRRCESRRDLPGPNP
jgi:hypothetical protein